MSQTDNEGIENPAPKGAWCRVLATVVTARVLEAQEARCGYLRTRKAVRACGVAAAVQRNVQNIVTLYRSIERDDARTAI